VERRLLEDVNSQKNELERLRVSVQLELSTISRGQFQNDYPVPLDLSEFYEVRAQNAKDMALLGAQHRSDIVSFYGQLSQINSYLLQRESAPYQRYANITQQIRMLDQFLLTEISAAQSVDFSWVK